MPAYQQALTPVFGYLSLLLAAALVLALFLPPRRQPEPARAPRPAERALAVTG